MVFICLLKTKNNFVHRIQVTSNAGFKNEQESRHTSCDYDDNSIQKPKNKTKANIKLTTNNSFIKNSIFSCFYSQYNVR